MNLRERYTVKAEPFKKDTDSKDSWNRLRVNVFENTEDGEQKLLGFYERNYGSLYNTFEPFEQGGKHYALISSDYTTTSVLSLPDCQIIAKEGDWNCYGFCPTGFYVPQQGDDQLHGKNLEKMAGRFGFVCGCVWGDDGSWKIQFLDLSEINSGKVIRDDRFGYVELDGDSDELADAISYIYVTESDAIYVHIKAIHNHQIYLKNKVGPKAIDANHLAEQQAEILIQSIEDFLKRAAKNLTVRPPETLGETEKKLIQQILYNTIVEVTEESDNSL